MGADFPVDSVHLDIPVRGLLRRLDSRCRFTRSPIAAILATCFFWAILFVFGFVYQKLMDFKKVYPENVPEWSTITAEVIHFVLPRVADTDQLTSKLLVTDLLPPGATLRTNIEQNHEKVKWSESIAVTLAFIAILDGTFVLAVRDQGLLTCGERGFVSAPRSVALNTTAPMPFVSASQILFPKGVASHSPRVARSGYPGRGSWRCLPRRGCIKGRRTGY